MPRKLEYESSGKSESRSGRSTAIVALAFSAAALTLVGLILLGVHRYAESTSLVLVAVFAAPVAATAIHFGWNSLRDIIRRK